MHVHTNTHLVEGAEEQCQWEVRARGQQVLEEVLQTAQGATSGLSEVQKCAS
jgi:hypothetical protein